MKVHHLAIGAHDVETVATFYARAFGLREVTRHFYTGECDEDEKSKNSSELRSIWLRDAEGGPVLMIEKIEESKRQRVRCVGVDAGFFLVAFEIREEEREGVEARLASMGAKVEDRTGFTSYLRDPEGNRVALSCYSF